MADSGLSLPPVDAMAAQRKDPAADVANVKTRAQAKAVAQDFEKMFITEMLQPMFAGLSTDGPTGGGNAEATFRPMLLEQYADAISRGGGIGVGDAVLKEILKLQGLE
jgi:peptidoglycan hydrolase FlgJ